MRLIRAFLVVFLVGATVPAAAGTLDANISSDSVRGTFSQALNGYNRYGTPYWDAGLLYTNDTDAWIGHLGLQVVGDTSARNASIRAGLGGRLYFVNSDPGDGAALGLGGTVTARIPQYNRFALRGHAYFAPDIISFHDLDQFFEYGIDFEYQLLKNNYVYVGYRQIRAEVSDGGHQTLDTGFHVGLRLTF